MEHTALFKDIRRKVPRNIAWGARDEMDVLQFYSSASMKLKTDKGGNNSSKSAVDALNPIEGMLWYEGYCFQDS